jgi:HEPN domain-containing protein
MKPAVAAWLELAEIDLGAARALLKDADFPTVVCFHAQQTVEKCLKALMESQGLNPPKSHDLIMLYGHTGDLIQLEEDTLAKLNQIYIDAHYPASLGSLPEGPPDAEDAVFFYEFAREALAQVKAFLHAGQDSGGRVYGCS